jgi:hypothetical protein
MTATATPVSAATEQKYDQNDNQDHIHGISPLMAAALFDWPHAQAFNGAFKVLFRICPRPSCLHFRAHEQFRSVFPVQARDTSLSLR